MSNQFLALSEVLYAYILNNSLREPDVLRRLREETEATNPHAIMSISPVQGQFMMLLLRLIGAVKTLEVGRVHRLQFALHGADDSRSRTNLCL